jgi:TusA-related sulfurtransferase
VVGYESVRVEYREVERGAEITYVSDDPALVEAIHEWFDAQLRDHGRHAVSSVEAR